MPDSAGSGFFTHQKKPGFPDNTIEIQHTDSSNNYVCEDTQDKIFALSYSEATNSSYGFDSDKGRIGASAYWLRSPDNYSDNYASYVGDGGNINSDQVHSFHIWARPAFRIKIS